MHITQFVMAYQTDHDKLRAMLPEGFTSLRPVLRINAELRKKSVYLELNTPVEKASVRGWLNIAAWELPTVTKTQNTVTFQTAELTIQFTPVGITGGCPAEKDNEGCFFLGANPRFRATETITAPKEFCNCTFHWSNGIGGKSIGKTLPAIPQEPKISYPKQKCTLQSAMNLPCIQVLGTYQVEFVRKEKSYS